MSDLILNCVACKQDFIFDHEQQTFFARRGYTNKPKRCPPCRLRAYPDRQTNGVTFRVVCSSCGTGTTVPFAPVARRPVYCKPCFQQRNT
ncbi:MAG TPA: CxxC-x17-CxxC domain-containing protein [Candidatus Polarisedimenticolia bacterium]|nr:CxxC-x17-CxxC domain-containing protein [Candidatus Polarisedimenticolia bacterium]